MPSTAIISPQIVDSTSIGRDLITAADQASAQAIIGVTGVDVTANYNWTGNHDFSGTFDADAAMFSGAVTALSFSGDGSALTNLPAQNNQALDTTSDVTFNSVSGDGSGLTNLPASNPFDQNLNTTDSPSFVDGDFSGTVQAEYVTGVNGTATDANLWFRPSFGQLFIKSGAGNIARFAPTGNLFYVNCSPQSSGLYDMGTSVQRWRSIGSVDGTFSGNLNTEVGGTQRVYNLGEDGDADTEYLETSWDTNTAYITVQETGAGVGRGLVVGAGNTYLSCAYNSTLNLYYGGARVFRAEAAATYMYYGGAKLLKLTAGVVGTDVTNTVSLGTDAVRWANVHSVNGSFSGNLNTEVGGTQRVYNLGVEGDTDTEYLETSWDTNVATIETKATGSGFALRELRLVNGGTSLKLQNAALTLMSNNANILRGSGHSATYLYAHSHGTILEVGDGEFKPFTANLALGSTANRWSTVYGVDGDFSGDVVMAANVDFTGLPTSDPLVAGRLWNDGGTMKISAG